MSIVGYVALGVVAVAVVVAVGLMLGSAHDIARYFRIRRM
jgi:hypothetical protein